MEIEVIGAIFARMTLDMHLLGVLMVSTPLLGGRKSVAILVAFVFVTGLVSGNVTMGGVRVIAILSVTGICWTVSSEGGSGDGDSRWYLRAGVLAALVTGTYVAMQAWLLTLFGVVAFPTGVVQALQTMVPAGSIVFVLVSILAYTDTIEARQADVSARTRYVSCLVVLWLFAGYAVGYALDTLEYVHITRVQNRLGATVARLVEISGPSGQFATTTLGVVALLTLYLILARDLSRPVLS